MSDTPTTTTTANDAQYATGVSEKIMRAARAAAVFWDKVIPFQFANPGPPAQVVSRFQSFTIEAVTPGTAQDAAAVSTDGATLTIASRGGVMLLADNAIRGAVPTFKPGAMENAALSVADDIDVLGLSLATSLSTNVAGSSGVALTFDDFRRALALLAIAKAPATVAREPLLGMASATFPGYLGWLHPVQIHHIGDTLVQSGAAFHQDPAVAKIAGFYEVGALPGYKGTLLGCHVFETTNTPLSDGNANYNGIIASAAAFGFGARFIGEWEWFRDVAARADKGAITSEVGFVELVDAYATRVRSSVTL